MSLIRNILVALGRTRNARLGLLLTLGLVAAGQGVLLPALPLLMEALALGADELGVTVAAGLLATLALALAPAAGALADRLGPGATARVGLAAICAASALLCGYTALVLGGVAGTAAAFAIVLGTRLANALGVAVLHPSAQAWLWEGVGAEEGTLLQGRASAVQNAGRIVGPLGVALVGGLGAAWTLAAGAAICAVALIILLLTPSPAASGARVAGPVGEPPRREARGGTRPLLATLLALHVLGGGAQFLLGPLLMARLDLGAAEAARWAGWLMALAAVASIAGNLLARRVPVLRRARAGAGLATVGAALLAAPVGPVAVVAGVAAIGAGIGAAVPSISAELMRRALPHARGRTAGRIAATQAAGYAVAAPAYGFLVAAAPLLAAALLLVPAVAAWVIVTAIGFHEG